jgi:hypothetical protein
MTNDKCKRVASIRSRPCNRPLVAVLPHPDTKAACRLSSRDDGGMRQDRAAGAGTRRDVLYLLWCRVVSSFLGSPSHKAEGHLQHSSLAADPTPGRPAPQPSRRCTRHAARPRRPLDVRIVSRGPPSPPHPPLNAAAAAAPCDEARHTLTHTHTLSRHAFVHRGNRAEGEPRTIAANCMPTCPSPRHIGRSPPLHIGHNKHEDSKCHRDTRAVNLPQHANQNKVLAIVRAPAANWCSWALHEEAYSASVHKRLLG